MATSLGLCTLVAEDDILVRSRRVQSLAVVRPQWRNSLNLLLFLPDRTCRPPWSASRTCSPGPTLRLTARARRSTPRPASFTPTRCCPGLCCSPSAPPASSRTSCASKGQGTSCGFQMSNSRRCGLKKKMKCLSRRHLPKLPKLLESEDVNMRIAAGETIALLFELARDMDCVSPPSVA